MTDKLKDIKPGDRVRVTFEGETKGVLGGLAVVAIGGEGAITSFTLSETIAPSFTIEKLSTPPVVGDRVTWGHGTIEWELIAIKGDVAIMFNGIRAWAEPYAEIKKVEQ